MKRVKIGNSEYELIKDNGDCFDYDKLVDMVTDYFYDYDYIFVDYAYDKMRLKGYYSNDNKKVSDVNNIDTLDDYIDNYCAYGAKYFLLKKMK